MEFTQHQIQTLFENENIRNVEEALDKLEKKDLGFEHKFVTENPSNTRLCDICKHPESYHLNHSLQMM